jgi:hypothetical protein
MPVSTVPFSREYNENDVIELRKRDDFTRKISEGKERGERMGCGVGFLNWSGTRASITVWLANDVKTRMEQA